MNRFTKGIIGLIAILAYVSVAIVGLLYFISELSTYLNNL